MAFLPAINWLMGVGMIAAVFFVIMFALLVNPPTALVNKMHESKKKD